MSILSSLLGGFHRASAEGPANPAVSPDSPDRSAAPKSGDVVFGKARVFSGDRLMVDGLSLRLGGIEAPALNEAFGRDARYALVRLCAGEVVWAEIQSVEEGLCVARCKLPDGRDLAAEMVRMGLALDADGGFRRMEPAVARQRLWRIDLAQRERITAAA